jgi:hypothetical protein
MMLGTWGNNFIVAETLLLQGQCSTLASWLIRIRSRCGTPAETKHNMRSEDEREKGR